MSATRSTVTWRVASIGVPGSGRRAGPGHGPGNAVGEQAVRALKGDQRRLGAWAEPAVDRPGIEPGLP
jgi:hypothetical protein